MPVEASSDINVKFINYVDKAYIILKIREIRIVEREDPYKFMQTWLQRHWLGEEE